MLKTRQKPDTEPVHNRMALVATDYCDLIDSVQTEAGDHWLEGLTSVLPQLHSAVVALGPAPTNIAHLPPYDFEERFDLFSRLRGALGDMDPYWMEFDLAQDNQAMSGSLADDLTDIYFELHQGLNWLTDQVLAPELAISDWQLGYQYHWGQHLIDAQRHLYDLHSRNQFAVQCG